MDWSKGYSASYYMARVDPVTWRDVERIEITGGSVKRKNDSLLQSADIDCVSYPGGERWVRVYLDTDQSGAHAHEALFTGLATSPDMDFNGSMMTNTITCYSVLKPADDVLLPRGWYAAGGQLGGDIIADLLSVCPAPVTIAEDSPRLSGDIIAEDGETRLTMAHRVLTAIGWRLRVDGYGRISAEPEHLIPRASFDPLEMDVIETQIGVSMDWYDCPNVLMCTDGDLTAIARDESENSPLSIANREREVWASENDCNLASNESLAQYAQRRLAELQMVEVSAEYDRRYFPNVLPGDLIRMHYPAQGLDGIFAVGDQSIELGHAARTSERITAPAILTREGEKVTITGLARLIGDDRNYIVSDDNDYVVGLSEMEV